MSDPEIEKLLDELDVVRKRRHFNELDPELRRPAQVDERKMNEMICELVAAREYPGPTPAMEKHRYTYLQMVENYGARWHRYSEPLECPHCKADLRSSSGPPFKREICVYDCVRDRTDRFECPDCGKVIAK